MDLKSLEFKTNEQLSDDERAFIRDSYKAYFMTCKPRKKAIGLCVVCGGVPSFKIGLIDVSFQREITSRGDGTAFYDATKPCYSLKFGPYPLIVQDNDVRAAIVEYLHSDERLSKYSNGDLLPDNGERLTMPLFTPLMNSNYTRLANARNIIYSAGKAIGFNSKSLRLHSLGNGIVSPFHISLNDESGLTFSECETITQLLK